MERNWQGLDVTWCWHLHSHFQTTRQITEVMLTNWATATASSYLEQAAHEECCLPFSLDSPESARLENGVISSSTPKSISPQDLASQPSEKIWHLLQGKLWRVPRSNNSYFESTLHIVLLLMQCEFLSFVPRGK